MTRRSFMRSFAGTIAAVAVAQGVVRKWLVPVVAEAPAMEMITHWKIIEMGAPKSIPDPIDSPDEPWQFETRHYVCRGGKWERTK